MAEIKVTINAKGVITGVDQVNNALNTVKGNAERTGKSVNSAFKIDLTAMIPGLGKAKDAISSLGGAASLLRNVFTGGLIGAGFIGAVSAAVDKSQEFEKALIGLRSVARATGNDVGEVEQAAKDLAADGLIPVSEVASGLKNLLSSGLSIDKSIKLFKALKDSAAFNRQGMLGLGEAVVGATQGLKNQQSIMVDNAGITKNLSILQKEYAASIGTTIGKLTEAQKVEANYQGVLREAAIFAGDAAKLSDTYAGATSRLGAAFDRMLAKFGSFITQSGLVKTAIGQLTSLFNAFGGGPKTTENRIEAIRSQLNGFLKDVKNSSYKDSLQKELNLLEETSAKELLRAGIKQRAILNEKDAKAKAAIEEEKASATRVKNEKDFDKLVKSLATKGGSPLENLKAEYNQRLKVINEAGALGIKTEKQVNDVKLALNKKYNADVAAANKTAKDKRIADAKEIAAAEKDIRSALTNAASNPFIGLGRNDKGGQGLFKTVNVPENVKAQGQDAVNRFTRNQDAGRGVGLLNEVANGAAGAKSLVSGAAGLALDAVLPGLGEAAQPIIKALTAGPEATKQMVKEFTKAIPDLVEGLIKAIPVLIEELANQFPVVIERLAEKAPDIIVALVKAAPKVGIALSLAMPKVALKFAGELIKNLPKIVSEAARAIFDAIKKVLSKLNPVGKDGPIGKLTGGGSKGVLDSIAGAGVGSALLGPVGGILGASTGFSGATKKLKKFFGFATGGEVKSVKGGTPFIDSVPAMLQQGEVVIDRRSNDGLKRFIEKDGGGNVAVMDKILKLLEAPIDVATSVQLNQKEFANIVLKLNRTGQRLA